MRSAAMSRFGTVTSLALAIFLSACGTATHDSGARLYRESCASCHGVDGHGNGPVAPIIEAVVPDLTRISARHRGVFPADEVYRMIDGHSRPASPGARNMPVWGYEFFGEDSDDRIAHQRATEKVERLVEYLRSIQQWQ